MPVYSENETAHCSAGINEARSALERAGTDTEKSTHNRKKNIAAATVKPIRKLAREKNMSFTVFT